MVIVQDGRSVQAAGSGGVIKLNLGQPRINQFAEIDVVAIRTLRNNLLLGVNELKILKVIPPNFPPDVVRDK